MTNEQINKVFSILGTNSFHSFYNRVLKTIEKSHLRTPEEFKETEARLKLELENLLK
mgnify:CR=1 FL=1